MKTIKPVKHLNEANVYFNDPESDAYFYIPAHLVSKANKKNGFDLLKLSPDTKGWNKLCVKCLESDSLDKLTRSSPFLSFRDSSSGGFIRRNWLTKQDKLVGVSLFKIENPKDAPPERVTWLQTLVIDEFCPYFCALYRNI